MVARPARGRKRVTQGKGMRITNIARLWRGRHNWHCSGLENRSRATVCGFESHPLRQYAADHRQVIGYPWVLVGCDPQDIETVLCPDSLAGKAFD